MLVVHDKHELLIDALLDRTKPVRRMARGAHDTCGDVKSN